MPDNNNVVLSREELSRLMEAAAEKGAAKALKLVGLDDDEAPRDLVELRQLVDSWRQVRKGALETLGKILTTAILACLAAGAWIWATTKSPN